MSKYCTICGSDIPEGAQTCAVCGAAVEPDFAAPAAPAQDYNYSESVVPDAGLGGYQAPDPQAPKGKFDIVKFAKEKWQILAGVAAALVVLIILISVIAGGAYKKAIKNAYKALYTGDEELFTKNVSMLTNDGLSWSDYKNLDNALEDVADDFSDRYGEVKSVKIKVVDCDSISKERIETIYESYVNEDDDDVELDEKDITAAKHVVYNVTIVCENDTVRDYYVSMYVVKEGGKWKIVFYDI